VQKLQLAIPSGMRNYLSHIHHAVKHMREFISFYVAPRDCEPSNDTHVQMNVPPQVMTYASPPFVFVHDDGDGEIQFSGLAMDLLSQLAVNVGFCYNVTYTRGVCQLERILLRC
jgi:hypothetical protein